MYESLVELKRSSRDMTRVFKYQGMQIYEKYWRDFYIPQMISDVLLLASCLPIQKSLFASSLIFQQSQQLYKQLKKLIILIQILRSSQRFQLSFYLTQLLLEQNKKYFYQNNKKYHQVYMGSTCKACDSSQIPLIEDRNYSTQIQNIVDQLRKKHEKQLKESKQYLLNDGKLYKGIISGDIKQGYGQLYNGKSVFYGTYKQNLPNGEGVIIFESNSYIKTNFENGKPNGETTEKSNSTLFHGDFKDGKKLKGILTTQQYRYQGSFKDNKFEGYGIIEFDNGDRYQGDFQQGKYNGDGVYEGRDKGVYKGQFLNGQFHGKGVFKWEDGSFYEGEYKNGLRNGSGKLFIQDKTLEGIWIDGKLINYNPGRIDKNVGENDTIQNSPTRNDLRGYVIQLF